MVPVGPLNFRSVTFSSIPEAGFTSLMLTKISSLTFIEELKNTPISIRISEVCIILLPKCDNIFILFFCNIFSKRLYSINMKARKRIGKAKFVTWLGVGTLKVTANIPTKTANITEATQAFNPNLFGELQKIIEIKKRIVGGKS